MVLLTSIVSWSKTKLNKHQEYKKFGLTYWLQTYISNFDKRWSDAHFVSFLFYYCCTNQDMKKNEEWSKTEESGLTKDFFRYAVQEIAREHTEKFDFD